MARTLDFESQKPPAWARDRRKRSLFLSVGLIAGLLLGFLLYVFSPRLFPSFSPAYPSTATSSSSPAPTLLSSNAYTASPSSSTSASLVPLHRPTVHKLTHERSHWTSFDNIRTVISFGDSWSATGRKACSLYTDEDAHNSTNTAYPGQTTTSGPNWIGYLTHELNRSEIHLYDLAIPGATVDSDVVRGLLPWDFKREVMQMVGPDSELTDDGMQHCKYMPRTFDPDTSLFTAFFGMNDVTACWDGNHCDIFDPPFVALFRSYETSLINLYKAGARNFLLLNAPSISPAAATVDQSEDDEITQAQANATLLFNALHHNLARHLRADFPGTTVFEFDVSALMQSVYKNASALPYADFKDLYNHCDEYSPVEMQDGMMATEEQREACGGLWPEEFLWSGDSHTTWPFHKAIASGALEVMDDYLPPVGEGD